MLGVAARQVVDIADELRHRFGPHAKCGEVLPSVRGDHATKQRLLIAEMCVQPLLAGPRGGGDPIDAEARQAVLREFGATAARISSRNSVLDLTWAS